MGARRVSTNGWLFWLGRHPKLGLVLLDEAIQGGVAEGMLRAFVLSSRNTAELERTDFKSQLSSEVSDQEFVQLVGAYNGFKTSRGMALKARAIALERDTLPENLQKSRSRSIGYAAIL